MKTQSLGNLIRTCAGILYGLLVASEMIGYIVLALGLLFNAINSGFEDVLLAVSYILLALIPLAIMLIILTLLHALVCGFAQLIDDAHDMRRHLLGDDEPQAAKTAPAPKAPAPKTPAPKPATKSAPKPETIAIEAELGKIFCPYCGKSAYLNDDDCCEHCGREVFINVTERKKPTTTTIKIDDEPSEAACPPGKWFCKGCGEYVENDKTKCECGYKRR